MTTLFLTIATSGLPGATKSVWCPRMCAALVDDSGAVTDSFAVKVRADGRHIEAAAALRHGITTAAASRTGVDEVFVLGAICGMRASGKRAQDRPGLISCARVLVAWQAEFVCRVVSDLYQRHGEPGSAWRRPGLQIVSLQDAATPWCRLPSTEDNGGYRKPTRDEAAAALCGLPVRPLPHSPDSNLERERALYAALRDRKAFEMEAVA
jgi:hypothetical protein